MLWRKRPAGPPGLHRGGNVKIVSTSISDVKILTPKKFVDHRGFFSETYSKKVLAEFGIDLRFVEDNHSLSAAAGTIRGLHFQTSPFAQDKLIRVVRGRILDVAVDIRRSSLTFGKHVAVELSETGWQQLLVPIGFAHGFCTLEANTEVIYKVTNYYSAEHDFGVAWNDPALEIPWPFEAAAATVSDKDQRHPTLNASPNLFA